MTGRVRAIGATVVVVGGVLAVVLIGGDSDQPESGQLFRQKLTATDRAEARRLASSSTELRRILGDHRYEVTAVGVWDASGVKRHPELLDFLTAVRVMVEPPLRTVRAQWPYIGNLRPCRRQWIPLTVRDLREVVVFVHLSQSLVAAIVPSRSAGLDDWEVTRRPDSACASL
jgi:hypothetical protein